MIPCVMRNRNTHFLFNSAIESMTELVLLLICPRLRCLGLFLLLPFKSKLQFKIANVCALK